MAKARANCTCASCGKTFEVEKACSNIRDAENWEKWAEVNCVECDQCKDVRIAKETRELLAADMSNGMPELVGSDKQVSWAVKIRRDYCNAFEKIKWERVERYMPNIDREAMTEIYQWLIDTKNNANWWIENRIIASGGMSSVLNSLTEHIKEHEAYRRRREISEPATEIAKEALAEATVRPSSDTTKVPVEITITDSDVKAEYERDDDFIRVMKKIGWTWHRENRVWHKAITTISGSAIDRAAEAGNALLRAGFPIIIWDNEIRSKAISGEFETLKKRWILFKAPDTLRVIWERDNYDIYRGLKYINGAKYDNSGFNFPLRQWRALLDFTDTFGFEIEQAAQIAIDTLKSAEDHAAIVTPGRPSTQEEPDGGIASILNSSREIIPDLRDD